MIVIHVLLACASNSLSAEKNNVTIGEFRATFDATNLRTKLVISGYNTNIRYETRSGPYIRAQSFAFSQSEISEITNDLAAKIRQSTESHGVTVSEVSTEFGMYGPVATCLGHIGMNGERASVLGKWYIGSTSLLSVLIIESRYFYKSREAMDFIGSIRPAHEPFPFESFPGHRALEAGVALKRPDELSRLSLGEVVGHYYGHLEAMRAISSRYPVLSARAIEATRGLDRLYSPYVNYAIADLELRIELSEYKKSAQYLALYGTIYKMIRLKSDAEKLLLGAENEVNGILPKNIKFILHDSPE